MSTYLFKLTLVLTNIKMFKYYNFYRFIKKYIINNKENKNGYIISNFLESMEQVQHLFDMETFKSNKENGLLFFKDEIHPSIFYEII